jgi:hypothetical protein
MPIKHTPQVRRIVNLMALASALIGFTTMATIFGTVMYRRYTIGLSCEEWVAQEVRPNAFRCLVGAVAQEGEETWLMIDHDIPYRIRLCDCATTCPLRTFAAEGDSIIKQAGQTDLLIIKPSGQRQHFEYPCCE